MIQPGRDILLSFRLRVEVVCHCDGWTTWSGPFVDGVWFLAWSGQAGFFPDAGVLDALQPGSADFGRMKMCAGVAEQDHVFFLAGACGEEEWRAACAVAEMDGCAV